MPGEGPLGFSREQLDRAKAQKERVERAIQASPPAELLVGLKTYQAVVSVAHLRQWARGVGVLSAKWIIDPGDASKLKAHDQLEEWIKSQMGPTIDLLEMGCSSDIGRWQTLQLEKGVKGAANNIGICLFKMSPSSKAGHMEFTHMIYSEHWREKSGVSLGDSDLWGEVSIDKYLLGKAYEHTPVALDSIIDGTSKVTDYSYTVQPNVNALADGGNRFVTVKGRNGWDALACKDFYDKMKEYAGSGKNANFLEVALGPNDQYAIITDDGSAWSANNDSGFSAKMKEITCTDVRTISFGPEGTWAIVMQSGHCHASCFPNPSGPLDAINEYQGNVQYVAMSGVKNEWIVGTHRDAYSSQGCVAAMITYLKEVKDSSSKPAIKRVQLGRKAEDWIVYNGISNSYRYNFDSGSHFFKTSKGSRLRSLH